jgi:TRAP-type mannitol/chloroaromatic compound transport system substrate-binding protein
MTAKMSALTRRNALAGGVALMAAPAIVGRAQAATEVTWKVQSHWPKASASFDESLAVVADKVKERTEGKMVLELYGAGEFAKGPEIFNIVRRGVVEMGTLSPGYILGEASTAGLALGVPGTFRQPWEFAYFLKNMGLEQMFNEDLAEYGVVSRAEKVYPTELVVSKPINSIADFASLKVRSSGSYLPLLEAAGAAPQFVDGAELYQSLASGVVDGAHWGAAQGAQSMSLWEVAKYHMRPALGMAMDTFIMNQAAVDALSEEMREDFFAVVDLHFWERTAQYQYLEELALSAGVADQGVQVTQFPQEVLDKFAEATSAILDEESAKGGNAEKATAMLRDYLKELGYL